MGAEEFEGVINAENQDAAIAYYKAHAPAAPYDIYWHSMYDVDFYNDEFKNPEDAIKFLMTKARKWKHAVMCKCGHNKYAYVVILAT